ncbi:extracellular solute-binding protein [Cellulomonas sp. McL0617]|uniref:extracellular solute-binding protein n=1 Tax=Cellulomonas sp. McL0617 TaxID=3415675 RepID=UPI003CEB338C
MSNSTRSSLRRRVRIATVALAAGTLALAGCSAGGSSNDSASGGSTGGVTTVTVMYQTSEFSKDDVAAFEKDNPDIKINFIEYDETRLNAMMTAGDPPDFVRGSPSANLFARGLATPLDDYVAKSKVLTKDDLLSVNDIWRWDGKSRGQGKLYGIIKDWSPDTTIWQNEKLFTDAGVAPLSTTESSNWDDILAKAKELKAKGVEIPLGIEWQWGVASLIQTMIAQQGGNMYNADFSKINLQTPEAERAIQWLIDYGKAGVGPTSLNPLPDGQDGPAFASGRMAMTMDGYWFGGNLQAQEAAAVAATSSMTPGPTFGDRISPVFGGVGAWIPAKSKHKDQAWRVMEYFMGGAPAVARSSSGWGLPVLNSLWANLPTAQPFQKAAIETAKAEVPFSKNLPDSPYASFTSANDVIDKALQEAIKGSTSAADTAKTIETEVNKLLAQGKDQLG